MFDSNLAAYNQIWSTLVFVQPFEYLQNITNAGHLLLKTPAVKFTLLIHETGFSEYDKYENVALGLILPFRKR